MLTIPNFGIILFIVPQFGKIGGDKVKYPVVERHIKEQRKTVTELAQSIGMSKSTLYNKLAGNSEVSLALAGKIKIALGATEPLEILFATTDDTPTPAA